MELLFATNNVHKLQEIRNAVGNYFSIIGLSDKGIREEIPETKETLEGNAIEKAEYIYTKYGIPCFADDTGLEVSALNGRPGVYSARFAGPDCSFSDNVSKLLNELAGESNRKACFRTVIAFICNNGIKCFEGKVDGVITEKPRGMDGFGYDPVFLPDGHDKTFAEMTLNEKNRISHRALAVEKFVDYLNKSVIKE